MAVLIGLALSLLSCTIGFVALNIQRHAQRKDRPRPLLNIAGVILNLFVGPTDLAAYSFAPQSLLAPVGTLSLVLNLIAAPQLHGDHVTAKDAKATGLIVFGTAICLISGAHGSDDGVEHPGPPDEPPLLAFAVYGLFVLVAVAGLGSLLVRLDSVGGREDAVANALLAGLLGATTVVAGKCIGSAASSSDFSLLRLLRAVLFLAALAPTHMYVLNRGMGRHSTVLFVPLNVASGLSANILSGFFLYGESPERPIIFFFGAATLMAGVLTLSLAQSAPKSPHPAAAERMPYLRSDSTGERALVKEATPVAKPHEASEKLGFADMFGALSCRMGLQRSKSGEGPKVV